MQCGKSGPFRVENDSVLTGDSALIQLFYTGNELTEMPHQRIDRLPTRLHHFQASMKPNVSLTDKVHDHLAT